MRRRARRPYDDADWRPIRRVVIARDGGCVLRNRGGCSSRLEVHHINPRGPSVSSNLVTLCGAHHRAVDNARRRGRPGRGRRW